MKIAFISNNPFGAQGTPGTYRLVEEFSKISEVVIYANLSNDISVDKVYEHSGNFSVIEVDYSDQKRTYSIISELQEFCPDVVYFCSGKVWRVDEGKFLQKLRAILPDVKIVLDIKSPPLGNNANFAEKFRRKNSKICKYLDLIFSRTEEDVSDWFSEVDAPVVLYPLGVPVERLAQRDMESDRIYCTKFVYIGALHKRRQFGRLLEALNEFTPKMRARFSLDIYGSGPHEEEFMQYVEDHNLEYMVNFKGAVEQDQLYAALEEYDAGIAWVPYADYEFAPSLKSYEYIAAGLVPLLSNTQAHLRLRDSDFYAEYFSNTTKSLVDKIYELQFTGVESAPVKKNQEKMHEFTWADVVRSYLMPALESLVEKGTPYKEVKPVYYPCSDSKIKLLHIHTFNRVMRRSVLFPFAELKNFGVEVLTLEDERCKDDVYFEGMPFEYYGKDAGRYRKVLERVIEEFSPDVVLISLGAGEARSVVAPLACSDVPVIMSECLPYQRILDVGEAKTSRGNVACQRQVILSLASHIHLTHEENLEGVPVCLQEKISVFPNDYTNAVISHGAEGKVSLAKKWHTIFCKCISERDKDVEIPEAGYDDEALFLERARNKMFNCGKATA